ncbi:hypothetical protein [Intestinibacter bartlettii]|uniref:hypothetical protein n=1 Tax=Intestinibacter bartlettii TaxID=261299 RepID=UPI002065ACE9|nr:MAG TPA: hypothetical protein [Caudoviricetes sp.]
MEIKIQVEAGELFNIKNLENEVSNLVKSTLYGIEGDAKRNCSVDTGRLRGSITTNITGKMSGECGTNVELKAAPLYRNIYRKSSKIGKKLI